MKPVTHADALEILQEAVRIAEADEVAGTPLPDTARTAQALASYYLLRAAASVQLQKIETRPVRVDPIRRPHHEREEG